MLFHVKAVMVTLFLNVRLFRRAVLIAVADAYEELYHGILSTGAATHTPEQIRVLLDL